MMKLRFFYLLLAFLFSGCAQLPSNVIAPTSWEIQQSKLAALTHWAISGKMAIITPKKRSSVNIHWQQVGDDFSINLTTFLGINVLEIKKTAGQTVIIDDQGKRYAGSDSEQLIQQLSGMAIPVEQLQQWIKGAPSEAEYQLNEQQLLASLKDGDEQRGIWALNYTDYRTLDTTPLPYKINLQRDDIRLKFAIAKWQINDLPK